MIRGATQQILDEADRSLHDALCVLSRTVKETKVVYGGGIVVVVVVVVVIVCLFVRLLRNVNGQCCSAVGS